MNIIKIISVYAVCLMLLSNCSRENSEGSSENLQRSNDEEIDSTSKSKDKVVVGAEVMTLGDPHVIVSNEKEGFVFNRSLPISGISVEISIYPKASGDALITGSDQYWRCTLGSTKEFEFNYFDYGKFLFARKFAAPEDGLYTNYVQNFPLDEASPEPLPLDRELIVIYSVMEKGSISSYTEAWSFKLPVSGESTEAKLESKAIEYQKYQWEKNGRRVAWESK